jgi:hypothetical protein
VVKDVSKIQARLRRLPALDTPLYPQFPYFYIYFFFFLFSEFEKKEEEEIYRRRIEEGYRGVPRARMGQTDRHEIFSHIREV